MKSLFSLFLSLMCATLCVAQTIENPAFSRSDIPAFHITKVKITEDTTYVFCSYYAEAGSWASISKETFLRDSKSHKTLPILRCEGLPYSPETRTFSQNESCELFFCFPSIAGAEQFDFIESEGERAFNIYGINLYKQFKTSYTDAELKQISEIVLAYDSSGDTDNTKLLEDQITLLYNLESYNASIGNYAEAIRLGTVEVAIREKVFGNEDPSYIESLGMLADNYAIIGNYDEAIRLQTEALQILKGIPPTDLIKRKIASICESLMTLCSEKKDYIRGEYYGEESLSLRKELTNEKDPYYINFLIRLINMYANGEYTSNAAFHSKELLKILREKAYEDPDYICDYITTLLNTGDYLIENYNLEEARKCTEEAKKWIENSKCNNPEVQFRVYTILAYTSNDNVDKAIENYKRALEIAQKSNLESSKYAQTLRLLGNLYAKAKKDTINAINCYEEAVNVVKNEKNNSNLAQLAQLYDALGYIYTPIDYTKSQNYYDNYVQITGDLYGKESILFGKALAYKSTREFWKYLENKSNKEVMVSDIFNSSRIIKRYLDIAMLCSTNKERSKLWHPYSELFDWWIPNVAFFLNADETNSLAYDASLFYKGYMMSMDNDIKMQLLESESESIKSLYTKYLSNVNTLERINNTPNNLISINVDSLKIAIDEDEISLTKMVFNSGFKFNKANLSWKDIQKSLNDNEVVIEFVSFNGVDKSNSNQFYVAFVLNNKLSAPKMIRLFRTNVLDSLMSVSNPDYYKISNLIWNEPLLLELYGYENIYFSPAGRLCSIGIEYLPISPDGEIMNNKYHMYRLSSSRELYNRNNKRNIKNVVLYGNLDYDWKQGEKSSERQTKSNSIIGVSRAYVDSISSRGGFDMLENTKGEITEISKVLSRSGIENIIYSEGTGTEESFKNLSGKKIDAIHLATHGMYISQVDALQEKSEHNFIFINSDDDFNTLINEKSLTRSALVMSGGNKLLRRDSIGWEEEDEILTALEISTLNLQNLDLVVLSACQTALGDVASEGVFGLQRGFKKAGANTILMSLDKVDDEATKILMVEFYKNLMDGKSKHQSLKDAQKYLRQFDNGKYDKPEYWASFIMLDGLN